MLCPCRVDSGKHGAPRAPVRVHARVCAADAAHLCTRERTRSAGYDGATGGANTLAAGAQAAPSQSRSRPPPPAPGHHGAQAGRGGDGAACEGTAGNQTRMHACTHRCTRIVAIGYVLQHTAFTGAVPSVTAVVGHVLVRHGPSPHLSLLSSSESVPSLSVRHGPNSRLASRQKPRRRSAPLDPSRISAFVASRYCQRARARQLLIDTASAPIFGIDAAGLTNEFNNKAAEITGYSRAQALGSDPGQATPPPPPSTLSRPSRHDGSGGPGDGMGPSDAPGARCSLACRPAVRPSKMACCCSARLPPPGSRRS